MKAAQLPLVAGATVPETAWRSVQGHEVTTHGEGWHVLIVYRGKHCPMCKQYLIELNGLQAAFEKAGASVMAVSADTKAAASDLFEELGLRFPLGYGLSISHMQGFGLYVSPSEPEPGHPFSEPALFVLRDGGQLHFACVSNAPYGRPPLKDVLDGVKEAIENDLPPHGQYRATESVARERSA